MEPVERIQIEHVIATLNQALSVHEDVNYHNNTGVTPEYVIGYSRSALQSAARLLTQLLDNDSHS